MNDKKKSYGLKLIFLTAIISGVSIFANNFGVKGFDPTIFTFSKNVIVALFLLSGIILLKEFKEIKSLTKQQWLSLLSIGLIGGSIPFILFFKGLQLTTGTASAFIHKTLFVYASILAIIFLKEKVNKWFIISALLITSGTFFMLLPKIQLESGHLFIFIATLFWAAENILSKKALKELSGTIVAWGRMFFGSIFILGYIILSKKTTLLTSITTTQYGWIIVTAIFLTLYVLTYYNGLKYLKVSTATSILAIGAPITIILNTVFIGKIITLHQIIGSIFILIGVISIALLNPQLKHEMVVIWKAKN